jgi:hypothetical protein
MLPGRLRHEQTYYSIGGGFVLTAAELEDLDRTPKGLKAAKQDAGYQYPFATAKEMLEMGAKHGKTIADMKRANEQAHMEPHELNARLDAGVEGHVRLYRPRLARRRHFAGRAERAPPGEERSTNG